MKTPSEHVQMASSAGNRKCPSRDWFWFTSDWLTEICDSFVDQSERVAKWK